MELLKKHMKAIVIILSALVLFVLYVVIRVNVTSYKKNNFVVSFNGISLNYYYDELYKAVILPYFYENHGGRDGWSYVDRQNNLNHINSADSYVLSFEEFECYGFNEGNRVSCDDESRNLENRKIDKTNATLLVSHGGEAHYEGEFIEDITEYIDELGRYYFEIHSTNKNVKTNILFTVKIGEDLEDF